MAGEIANQYPDVVRAFVVGNEVCCARYGSRGPRRDHPRGQGAGESAGNYADVWEFWLRKTQVAAAADFITIHILTYWEDSRSPPIMPRRTSNRSGATRSKPCRRR